MSDEHSEHMEYLERRDARKDMQAEADRLANEREHEERQAWLDRTDRQFEESLDNSRRQVAALERCAAALERLAGLG